MSKFISKVSYLNKLLNSYKFINYYKKVISPEKNSGAFCIIEKQQKDLPSYIYANSNIRYLSASYSLSAGYNLLYTGFGTCNYSALAMNNFLEGQRYPKNCLTNEEVINPYIVINRYNQKGHSYHCYNIIEDNKQNLVICNTYRQFFSREFMKILTGYDSNFFYIEKEDMKDLNSWLKQTSFTFVGNETELKQMLEEGTQLVYDAYQLDEKSKTIYSDYIQKCWQPVKNILQNKPDKPTYNLPNVKVELKQSYQIHKLNKQVECRF